MEIGYLSECIIKICEEAILESAMKNGGLYSDAMRFFVNSQLPDGSKWGQPLNLRFYVGTLPGISREKIKDIKGGKEYTAILRFAPGKGGGSGITIEAPASNQLFNMLSTDKKTLNDVGRAFYDFASKKSGKLNASIGKWLKDRDSFLHHIVGFGNRDKYRIEDVMFKSIKYENTMIDPTRRKWPSSRTEIWIPVTADVIVKVKEK